MPDSYSMSAEHRYMSDILRSYWHEYTQLNNQMNNFVPRQLHEYDEEYEAELSRMVKLNPNAPLRELEESVRSGILVGFNNQFAERFSTSTKKLFISVVFMSQALCEALINQILVLRFHDEEITELYKVWERASFVDKWVLAPKSFLPSYKFDKSGKIYQTLMNLVEHRNNYTHYKPRIVTEGK